MAPSPTRDAIIKMIDERSAPLREELEDARKIGVDTAGFNQLLGALDELAFLRDEIIEMTAPGSRALDAPAMSAEWRALDPRPTCPKCREHPELACAKCAVWLLSRTKEKGR